jgi:hypothetical protein
MAELIALLANVDSFKELAAALGREADGKKLQAQLSKNLRKAIEPAKTEAAASLMSMQALDRAHEEPLRVAVVAGLGVATRLSGRTTGVRVRSKKVAVRGFRNAPKRLNNAKGWRHPVYGDRNVWVQQIGKPDWFDGPMKINKPRYRVAVLAAMQESADRIASRK